VWVSSNITLVCYKAMDRTGAGTVNSITSGINWAADFARNYSNAKVRMHSFCMQNKVAGVCIISGDRQQERQETVCLQGCPPLRTI
jgi:hypothetical protein